MATQEATKVEAPKAKEYKHGRNPGQDGFNEYDATTWTRRFRESVLDEWFASNPRSYSAYYEERKGDGTEMLKHVSKQILSRYRNSVTRPKTS